MQIVKKSYNDSYLYNLEQKRHNQLLSQFIIQADRIEDKTSSEFNGISEEIKRLQRSNVLYALMMRDDVVLCINNKEMPRAFKVFMAKDLREGQNARRKVFIDLTGIVTLKDGFYVCKNPQYLITYLFQGLCYYLYEFDTTRLLNNSNITISGAEAFSAMFSYIIDYMRIVGYEQNKIKIAYMSVLYYMKNVMGKELDQYSKNVAAKIAGVPTSNINAYDMYYKEEDFANINTFVTAIAENFKLKGLTTEVFVQKWAYAFTPSAMYACELFTSFGGVLVATYVGAYLVNQKQIEKICGNSMIKFSTEIINLGSDFILDKYRESFDNWTSKDAQIIKEALTKKAGPVPEDAKIKPVDYQTKPSLLSRTKKLIEHYTSINEKEKLSKELSKHGIGVSKMYKKSITSKRNAYQKGTLPEYCKLISKHLNKKDEEKLYHELSISYGKMSKDMSDSRVEGKKDIARKFAEAMSEYRSAMNNL
jgi:hypothetical protein